jgi:hypothetical protein
MSPYPYTFLEVHIKFPTFDPPTDAYISIGFPELRQAKWYHQHIKGTALHHEQNLLSQRKDRMVSVRLPSRFTQISASSKCDGFYFTVSDEGLAEQWVASLVVWKFLQGSKTQLYVTRNWAQDPNVEKLLRDCPTELPRDRQRDRPKEPGRAQNSIQRVF